ncbi:MAG: pilus assembly protein PilM, partial [Planctomycetota bacterium]
NKLVEKKRRCVKNTALEPVLMDVDGLALLNSFSELVKSDSHRTVAVLNVGGTYANLAILGHDSMPFVRDIVCSADGVLEPGPEEQEQAATHAWQNAFRKLTDDVNNTLRYYTARVKKNAVEKVLVCGGFALLDGFVDWLGSRLTTKAVLWNPFEGMSCYGDQNCLYLLREKGPALAVAAGLAMRSI